MKKALLLLHSIFFFTVGYSQCIKAGWVKSFGGSTQYESIFDGGRRNDGKFVVAGSKGSGTLNLGSLNVSSTSFYNIFLAIHDSSGTFESANIIGAYTASGDQLTVTKVFVGKDNTVYLCGHYKGSTVSIAGMALQSVTRTTVFVARFDANLQYLWKTHSTQTGADSQANDLTVDLNKNVYVTGNFEDDAFMFQDSVIENQGGWNLWRDDAYLLKLDSTGHIVYLKNIGSPNDEAGRTVTADSSGNIIVTGVTNQTNGWLTFGVNIGAFIPSGPSQTFYIAKFDGVSGNCKWAKIAAGSFSSSLLYPYEAVAGENNSVFICGTITGTVNFSPNTFTSADQNGFIAKVDSSGNSLWLDPIGGQNTSEYATSLSYYNGKVAVSGSLFSNQPYVGKFPLYSTLAGSHTAFSALYNSNGELSFARSNYSSPSNGLGNRISMIDNAGNMMIWGSFISTQTWYPISLTNSSSNYKAFLVKYIPFAPPSALTVNAGPDKLIACGSSVQLNGSTTPTNTPFGWYPNLGFSANGTKTPTVNPGTNTTYILYSTYQGCTFRDTVNVSYSNNTLSVNAPGSVTMCSGDSVQILTTTSDAAATYTWSPTAYINTSTSQNPWVKPQVTTNYILTATLNGCKAYDTVRVISNPKPYLYLPKQDFYSPYWRQHLCIGNTLPFDMGDPLNTYTIQTPALVTNVSNNLATIYGNTNGLLKATVTSPEGCTKKDSVLVVFHQNQSAPPIYTNPSNRSACPGDSVNFYVTLNNSNQYNYQYGFWTGWQVDSLDGDGWQDINIWDPRYEVFNASYGWPTSTYTSTLRIWSVGAGSNGYKYRLFSSDYCSPRAFSNTAILSVGPKITAQPLSRSFCQNTTDSLSVNSSSAGSIYEWEIKQGGTFVPLVNQPGVMVANGRYLRLVNIQPSLHGTVVRCKLTGCTPNSFAYTDSAVISVIAIPIVLTQPAGDSICAGVIDSLVVQTNSGPYTYRWYQNNTALTYNTSQLSGYNTNKLTFTPVWMQQNNYTYYCRISNATCNFNVNTDTTRFYVKPQPTVTTSPSTQIICTDGYGTISGAGADTYTWSPSAGLNSTSGDSVIANPSIATTYTITGTASSNGCSNTATAIVNVSNSIVVTVVSSANSVCQGSSVTLTASGANSYSWSPNIGLSSTTGATVTASPMSNMSYTVTGTNGSCTKTAGKSLTSLPTPTVTTSPAASVCEGSSANLSASGAIYYSWSPGSSLNSTTTANVVATPATTTTYTITGSNYAGCYQVKYVNVTVNPIPLISLSSSGDTVCSGASANLQASGATTYTWSPSTGLSSTSGSMVTATPSSTITYTATGTSSGCRGGSSIIINVISSPSVSWNPGLPDTLCSNFGVYTLIEGTPSGGTFSGPGITGNVFDPSMVSTGQYTFTYEFTDSISGCSGFADRIYYVDVCAGLKPDPEESFHLFNEGDILKFRNDKLFKEDFVIELYSSGGSLLTKNKFNGVESGQLSVKDIAQGIYIVRVYNNSNSKVYRIPVIR